MQRFTIRFGAVIAFQFMLLLTIVGFSQYTVATGQTVLLKIGPFDPPSLFCGDDACLKYGISTLGCQTLRGPDPVRLAPAYVELASESDG